MHLITPLGVEKLRTALHVKAKESPGFRFYMLYDKVYLRDVLSFAYALCYANRGQPGIDGQTFQDIASYGTDRWLDELAKPTWRSMNTPGPGFVRGCVRNRTCRVGLKHVFPTNTCTAIWACSSSHS